MHDDLLLDALQTEARRVLDLEPSAMSEPVPWCGGWTVADVVGHLSSVQRWATALIATPGVYVKRREMQPAPVGAELLPWYAEGVDPMLASLDADLEVIVQTWAGEQPRRWWLRRLAHETAMHRWDAEAGAFGTAAARPIEAELAADGIDEMFDNFLPLAADKFDGRGQTMHLGATDTLDEWQLTFAANGASVQRAEAEADVVLRGPAGALLLLLWNRHVPGLEVPGLELLGDTTVVDLWKRTARF